MSRGRNGRCPACGGTTLEEVLRIHSVPVHSMILLGDAEAARGFPRSRIELTHCADCGFLFNAAFEAAAMRYDLRFEESQHFSPTFGRFARLLIEQLAAGGALAGRHVVEVGCGRGEFLAALCQHATCRGTGIDPGWRAGRIEGPPLEGVRFLAEPLGPHHRRLGADLLLCRHTLEHIAEVRDFLLQAARLGEGRPGFRLIFETPDAGRILAEGAFWDVYHEHCSYFTAAALCGLFERAGLAVTRCQSVFAGQYLLLDATPAASPTAPAAPPAPGAAATYAKAFSDSMARWHRRAGAWTAAGERLVLWGGGSKAVAFLAALGLDAEVTAVVDINPYRQGHFLPGGGHPIVAPEELKKLRPDRVLAMNAVYREEIATALTSLGLDPALEALA